MRIDLVTTCVGDEYREHLSKTLCAWLRGLRRHDSLTVVTDEATFDEPWFIDTQPLVRTVTTDVFTRNGAAFNKGAALNAGIDYGPTDWVLAFDCDILPPEGWMQVVEWEVQRHGENLSRQQLYGAKRYALSDYPVHLGVKGEYDEESKKYYIPIDRTWYPRGYFQLWNMQRLRGGWPPYTEQIEHAGGYDTQFADEWPMAGWCEIPLRLVHLGTKSKNWFGPGTTREQMRRAQSEARQRRRFDRRKAL